MQDRRNEHAEVGCSTGSLNPRKHIDGHSTAAFVSRRHFSILVLAIPHDGTDTPDASGFSNSRETGLFPEKRSGSPTAITRAFLQLRSFSDFRFLTSSCPIVVVHVCRLQPKPSCEIPLSEIYPSLQSSAIVDFPAIGLAWHVLIPARFVAERRVRYVSVDDVRAFIDLALEPIRRIAE